MAKTSDTRGVEYWTVPEAVNWIAFRTEPDMAPATIFADPGTARFTSPEIMGALKARAAGDPRSWPPKGVCPRHPTWPQPADGSRPEVAAWRCRAIARRWMREKGLTAPQLLEHADAERMRYAMEQEAETAQQADLAHALDELNSSIATSRIVAWGRPSKTWGPPQSPPLREAIKPSIIDDPRRIDHFGCFCIRYDGGGFEWLHDPGPFFYDIQVRAADIRRNWPIVRDQLPPPTNSDLRKYWAAYVADNNDPDRHPTVAQQKAAAHDYFKPLGFGAPSDCRLEALRRNPPTPGHWAKAGRMPK